MPQTQSRKPSEIDALLVDYSNRKLDEEADRQGVPRDFVRRMAGAESANRPDVIKGQRRSPAGAIGKMQLMPGTAKDLGVDPYDVDQNISGGVAYAKQQLEQFGGDERLAAAAYNAGAGAVKKYGGVPPFKETQNYVRKVAGSEQGASEIDRLYDQFVGQQPTAPQPKTAPLSTVRRSQTLQKPPSPDTAPRRLPQISSTRRRAQEDVLYEWAKATPGATNEQLIEARRLLSAIPEADFQKALKEGGKPIPGKPFRRATLAESLRSQFEPDARLTEADKRVQQRVEARRKMSLPRRLYEDFAEGAAQGVQVLKDTASDTAEMVGRAAGGDFRPLIEGGKEAFYRTGEYAARVNPSLGKPEAYQQEAERIAQQRRERQLREGGVDAQIAEQMRRQFAESEEATPDIAGRIARGVGLAGVTSAPALVGGVAGGVRGMLAATAATQDYRDPVQAALNLGGAAASVGAARRVAQNVAARTAGLSPTKQALAQGAVAIPVGSATNIGQEAVGQALRGKFDPQQLAEAGITGAVLSGQDALAGIAQRRTSAGRATPEPPARIATPERAEAPLAQVQEPAPRAVRPGTEEITPEFRTRAQRQALELMGLSPAEIEAEMARRAPVQQAEPTAQPQPPRRVEALRPPVIATEMPAPPPPAPPPPGQRAGIPEPTARRQSETGALEEIGDFFGEMAREEAPKMVTHSNPALDGKPILAETSDGKVVVANPENKSGVSVVRNRTETSTTGSLETAYRKLGTNDPEVISQLLRDADKRFKKSATPEEADASAKAWAKVQRLTDAEQAALTEVLPPRTFAPVRPEYRGEPGETYSRSVEDIPLREVNPQLDRNLRDLLNFFDEVKDKPKPKIVEDAAQRLREASTGQRAGSGGQQLVDMAIVAGWKVYERGMTYAKWAKEVIQEAGERVRPHLRATWKQIQADRSFLSEEGGSAKLGLGIPEALRRRGRASETVGGLQTVAQLGNPRFVIRNVLQHVAYGKQERGAMRLAAALDWAISNVTGKGRQVTAPRGSDLASYVRNWGKAIEAYKANQPLPGKPNADYLTADGNALDKAVGKVMAHINEIPDAANWQTRFENSLDSIVRAAKRSGTKIDIDEVIDQAWMEANRAALRDKNFVSESALKFKQALNNASSPIFGTDKFGVGDFVLKYAQTPGALLKRGLEHSPLGLFQVAKEAATPGPFRRRNTLLALSRAVTGTAEGLGLGAALAAAGVLVGPEQEDRTGAAMEREQGIRGYSLNASALRRLLTGESTKMQKGDQLYTIDWLQPWAMGASAGAAIYDLYHDGRLGASSAAGATGKAVYDSLAKTLDVMGDQSVLKNLSRYIGRTTGDSFTEKVLSFAKSAGLDVPSSFVPSVARQVRQAIDPYERDTRAEERGGIRGFAREAANRALSQLPGVSETFPTRPSYLTGQNKKTALGEYSVPARIAAQFSPANISTYAPKLVAREISRLSRVGERVVVSFPAALGEKQVGEKGYRESTKSLRERERQFAEDFSTMSQDLIESPAYALADDAEKAKSLKALATHLRERTYKAVRPKNVYDFLPKATVPGGRRPPKLLPQFVR